MSATSRLINLARNRNEDDYIGMLIAYRHIVFRLEKVYVKNCAHKQSNMCLKFFRSPTPKVGTLFLMMFECIFKFDGQIETVYVCNLIRLVFFMVHALLYT